MTLSNTIGFALRMGEPLILWPGDGFGLALFDLSHWLVSNLLFRVAAQNIESTVAVCIV
jgi:hypothetical protein